MSIAKGHNGTVSFDGQFVTIEREGVLARLSFGKGDKRIPIQHITSVQLKPAGALTNGFIQFSLGGGHERGGGKGSRTMNAAQDENSVIFLKAQQPAFDALRAEIEAGIASGSPSAAPAPDLADQISKLAGLRDQGLLTEDEFRSKKADLLSRM